MFVERDPSKPVLPTSVVLRGMLPFLWPHGDMLTRWRMTVAVLSVFIGSGLQALAPLLFASAVDEIAANVSPTASVPVALLSAYALVFALNRVINDARWWLLAPVQWRLQRNVMGAATRQGHALGLRFHLTHKTGHITDIVSRGGGAGIGLLTGVVLGTLLPLVSLLVSVGWVIATRLDARYLLIIVATVIVYGVVLILGAEKQAPLQRATNAQFTLAHGRAVDSLFNYETIKYFGSERRVLQSVADQLRKWREAGMAHYRWRTISGLIPAAVLGAGLTLMMWMAARQTIAGEMTIGGLTLVNAYLLQVLLPLENAGQTYRDTKQALVNLEQFVALLREEPEVLDRPAATPMPSGPGAIRFEDVSFAYDVHRPVLEHVSFEVLPGTTTAIVGPSGGGKTTVGRLLFRFYEPNRGTITIDGNDVQDVTIDSVRAAIGVVPQDTVLFNDTLLHNIAFARDGASLEEVERAAKLAHIHDFIAGLPDGYATVVGERGLKLSGGEKQRVAIARVLLKRPRILLFDEATSALDTRTERLIQQNLREVSRGLTTIIIAHRLSTVAHADQILVMDGGRIVERGTHASLLEANGVYGALWRKQLEAPDAS